MKKVVTITLNPALDLTGSLKAFNQGGVSLVEQSSFHAAGKGVNVAQVLRDLGAEVAVTGFLGRDNQEMFCQLFEKIGAKDHFVRVDGATRINVKLVESDDRVSDINFPGVSVSSSDKQKFEQKLKELSQEYDVFVLAGSLPVGVSPEECQNWISMLQGSGKHVLFDSSREALKTGLTASPWLIKPNEEELGYLVDKKIESIEECLDAAAYLDPFAIPNLVISLGAEGVLWKKEQRWLHAKPPKVDIVSTVGAGDTLVAGMCWAHLNKWDDKDALAFATALSALAVSQVGVGVTDIEKVSALQQTIKITSLTEAID
ncbi:1-phosphofructokinase [Vibrio nigripulchritudo]|uniref:1-phosphofructokinase n=1 Tax=Vibrio nigripulchritudo TaxID=28173 RepID=UPI0005FA75EE|nr:1-phosphofructokinase [Vibrio nigripulchritudo]KJY74680.1 1-phosphofructokinase [Vibrio nigripulchritudo]